MNRDHLVVLPRAALRKLSAQKKHVLTWRRWKREAPVGVVQRGDTISFKESGGLVMAQATVARVSERLRQGMFEVRLTLRGYRMLRIPFPVYKRDRRSWIVCAATRDERQQALLTSSSPSVAQLRTAVERHMKRLPSASALHRALHTAVTSPSEKRHTSGLIFFLLLLLSIREDVELPDDLAVFLTSSPTRVFPFATFSSRKKRT